jgi:hypothetical protein
VTWPRSLNLSVQKVHVSAQTRPSRRGAAVRTNLMSTRQGDPSWTPWAARDAGRAGDTSGDATLDPEPVAPRLPEGHSARGTD